MATIAQIKRRRLMQIAEGYLDLAIIFEDRWSLDLPHRKRLAAQAIKCLNQIENPGAHRASILRLKGEAHRIAEQYWQATHLLKSATQLEPENLNSWLSLAWCFKRTGQLKLAVGALENAIQIDPFSAIAHYNLACYWALLESVPRTVLHLATAMDLNHRYFDLVAGEHDFDAIRDAGDFQSLMQVHV